MITAETILQETRLWSQFEQVKLATRLFEQAQEFVVPTNEDRRAAFRRVRGKYRHLLPSLEEFQAEKRRELELEERRYAERFGRGAESQQ